MRQTKNRRDSSHGAHRKTVGLYIPTHDERAANVAKYLAMVDFAAHKVLT